MNILNSSFECLNQIFTENGGLKVILTDVPTLTVISLSMTRTELLKFDSSNLTVLNLLIAGLFYSAGKIIPGISGAALLMLLGIYEYLLGILANPLTLSFMELIKLTPFFISFVGSSYLLIKIINLLLKKHYNKTYSAILGFVLGSILFIYPGFSFDIRGILCIILLILSASFVLIFEKISGK